MSLINVNNIRKGMIIAIASFVMSGCSVMIARLGEFPESLERKESKEKVRKEIGNLIGTRESSAGLVDTFIVKGKYRDEYAAYHHSLMNAVTLFLWEIYGTPYEIIMLPYNLFSTKKLEVWYLHNKAVNYYLRPINYKPIKNEGA
jgi:hypothetical protein